MSEKLKQFLTASGLEKYVEIFVDAGIDLDVLSDLESSDFRELGVSLGDQKRIEKAIARQSDDRELVERRFLSLLFIDLVGSVEMAVRMDPEDFRRAMFAYQSKCEEILESFGGHLARKFGDGILAYFGFPQSRENDTRRAAEASLEIVRQIPMMSDQVGVTLQVRVGIATGMALVDENPMDVGLERGQVFGETPNLAARLQALAGPNSIVVCEPTQSVLADQFDLLDMGRPELKGLPHPVRVWELKAKSARSTRSGVGLRLSSRPLLNRVAEIETVRHAWDEVVAGSGRAVVIDGCAGIGKSSLVGHLIDLFDEAEPTTVYWQCDIDQRGRPLHPVAAHLEREIADRADLLDCDEARATQDWLSENCADIEGAQVLLALILMAGQSPKEDVASKDARSQMFEFLSSYLQTLQSRCPVKLIVEDLHWIDPTTLEFLEELIDRLPDLRILVLCSQRDTEPVELPAVDHLTTLHLEALDQDLSGQILERELEHFNVPSALKSQILDRCEGIPLYIEEVARAVSESNRGADGETLTIPDRPLDLHGSDLPSSLLGPLLSRLDNRTGARELASVASTIGRRFSMTMLRRLMDKPESQILEILSQLASAQILRRLDDAQYEFGHSVMQDAAYQVLLKDRRIASHRTIAEVVQEEFPGTPDARPANIAYHYGAAEMWPEARTFWINAALEMQQFGAHREAVGYCRRALESNERCEGDEIKRDNEIEIRELMCVSQEVDEWWSNDYKENLEYVQKLRAERGDTSEQLMILNGLAGANLLAGRVGEARKLAVRLLDETLNPSALHQIFANRMLGICEFYSGQFEASKAHFEKAITLSKSVDKTLLKQYYYADVALVARVFVLWSNILQGNRDYIDKHLEAVKSDALAEQDPPSRMYALGVLAACYQGLSDRETCSIVAGEALTVAIEEEQPYWKAWATIMSGWASGSLEGVAKIEEGLSAYAATGTRQIVPFARVLLCQTYVVAGETGEADKLLGRLVDSADSHELRFVDEMVAQLLEQLRH